MTKQLTAVQLEYRRLRFKLFEGVFVLAVIPFVLTAISVRFAFPSIISRISLGAALLGILISVIYIRREWKCPACGTNFAYGFSTLGGKCLSCRAQLYIPRRSKDGSRIYPR